MNKKDPLSDLQQRLTELEAQEKHLKNEMKSLAANIQKNATPMGIARGMVSGVFKDKHGTAAETAKAALGLGAGFVANNLMAKQRKAALIGKVATLAVGFLVSRLAERKRKKAASKAIS
jgi:citrate synthase